MECLWRILGTVIPILILRKKVINDKMGGYLWMFYGLTHFYWKTDMPEIWSPLCMVRMDLILEPQVMVCEMITKDRIPF